MSFNYKTKKTPPRPAFEPWALGIEVRWVTDRATQDYMYVLRNN